jgi:hypothetical protein
MNPPNILAAASTLCAMVAVIFWLVFGLTTKSFFGEVIMEIE